MKRETEMWIVVNNESFVKRVQTQQYLYTAAALPDAKLTVSSVTSKKTARKQQLSLYSTAVQAPPHFSRKSVSD